MLEGGRLDRSGGCGAWRTWGGGKTGQTAAEVRGHGSHDCGAVLGERGSPGTGSAE